MSFKFKIRHLMVNVAPEGGGNCEGQSREDPRSNCGIPSCFPPDKHPQSKCDPPSCQGDQDDKDRAQKLDELTRSNLALLQREMRQALNPEP